MAILAGVNTSAVYRLKFTREQLPDNIKQVFLPPFLLHSLPISLSSAFLFKTRGENER